MLKETTEIMITKELGYKWKQYTESERNNYCQAKVIGGEENSDTAKE